PTDGYFFDDARSRRRGAINFSVPSAPLFDIARQRFFEASVAPPEYSFPEESVQAPRSAGSDRPLWLDTFLREAVLSYRDVPRRRKAQRTIAGGKRGEAERTHR